MVGFTSREMGRRSGEGSTTIGLGLRELSTTIDGIDVELSASVSESPESALILEAMPWTTGDTGSKASETDGSAEVLECTAERPVKKESDGVAATNSDEFEAELSFVDRKGAG